MIRNEILAESSTKHHEDSQPFYERFSSNFNRLIKYVATHLCKITSLNVPTKKIIVAESMRTVIDDLETTREKQLETFVSDRLVVSK